VCVLILYIKFYFGILGASKIITIISILFAIVLYFISVIALKIFTKEEFKGCVEIIQTLKPYETPLSENAVFVYDVEATYDGRVVYSDVVKNVQLVRSDEIEIMQLSDILIGAVSYINRDLNVTSNGKTEIINLILEKTGQGLKYTTSPKIFHNKFDIFRWKPRND